MGRILPSVRLARDVRPRTRRVHADAPPVPPQATAPNPAEQAAKLRAAWNHAQPWRGTLVERYLLARSCVLPPPDTDLRFDPKAWNWIERRNMPAMVAMCTDAITGEPRTLHYTFLRPDGSGKADIDKPKLLMPGHPKKGAVIRLWPDDLVGSSLGVAEGIESALNSAHAYKPMWACIDAGNLGELPPLPGIEFLMICGDNDNAGHRAAEATRDRWIAALRSVRCAFPVKPGADFADEVDQ